VRQGWSADARASDSVERRNAARKLAITHNTVKNASAPERGIVPAVLAITAGDFRFTARLEEGAAPQTIAVLRTLLPLESQLVQARWSGESAWVPMGFEVDLGLGPENANSYPAAGELLLYPGGLSEVEILFPYGATCFASKMGQLAGNHFATIAEGAEQLPELGRVILWEGAQPIRFEET
jgi:Protein of unknown function (DUF3830)